MLKIYEKFDFVSNIRTESHCSKRSQFILICGSNPFCLLVILLEVHKVEEHKIQDGILAKRFDTIQNQN